MFSMFGFFVQAIVTGDHLSHLPRVFFLLQACPARCFPPCNCMQATIRLSCILVRCTVSREFLSTSAFVPPPGQMYQGVAYNNVPLPSDCCAVQARDPLRTLTTILQVSPLLLAIISQCHILKLPSRRIPVFKHATVACSLCTVQRTVI